MGDMGGAGLIGGVSNLMAAAMQTAGAYGQANVLNTFEQPLTQIAGLCYLAAVCAAILSAAIYGQYRNALYFLIGPALFYYAITVRTDVMGTELRIGDRRVPGSIPDQIRFLKEYAHSAQYDGAARVSYVYLGYDALVTSVVQGIVGRILDTRNQEDQLLRARERVFSWVIHGLPAEGAFVKLLALGNYGHCAHVNALSIELQNEKIIRIFNFFTIYTYRGYIIKAEYDALRKKTFDLDPQSWTLLQASPRVQNQYRRRAVTCEQVWNSTAQVAREIATEILRDGRLQELFGHEAPVDRSLPWDQIRRDLLTTLAGGPHQVGRNRPEDILAAYMIRHTVANNPLDRLTSEVYSRAPFQPDRASNILQRIGEAESYGAYMKIVYIAGAIPYAQGLLLYILSLAYPFFTLFLVMPGRAQAFLLWFSLWAWVKSWDVGYAVVDIARKLLWQFMGHGTNAFRERIDWNEPGTIYNLITYNDPIVTHNTYLQLMAFLTASVPFLTAHFCLGAVNMMDFLKMSVDQNAAKFQRLRTAGARRALITTPAERVRNEEQVRAAMAAAERTRDYYLRHGTLPPDIADMAARARGPGEAVVGHGGTGIPRAGTTFRGLPRSQEGIPGDPHSRQFGDMSLQRAMAIGYQVGLQNFQFSAEGQRLHQWLGVAAGRLSTFSYGSGETYLNAYTAHLLHQTHHGVNVGGGTTSVGGEPTVPIADPLQGIASPAAPPAGDN